MKANMRWLMVYLAAVCVPSILHADQGSLDGRSLTNAWATASDSAVFGEALPELAGEPTLLAQAETEADKEAAQSEQCLQFAGDPNADVGEIIRAGCQPTLAQMSALMDNPLGNVAMLFTQFDWYIKKDPGSGREDTQFNYMGIAQFPKKLSDKWNLINRVIWNVPSVPLDQDQIDEGFSSAPGGEGDLLPPPPGFTPPGGGPLPIDVFRGRTTGFGDMVYVGLFSPSETKTVGANNGKFTWGLGFDLGLPTASEDILGSGKWTAGPSALAVYMGPKWKIGSLITHYEDFASKDDNRADVSLTNLQYFLYYSLSETTAIGAAPNIICNWEQSSDNECTVPVGLGFSTTVNIGKVPVRFGAEVHYSVVQPDDVLGTKWDFRFYVIPAAPSALFSWMQ
ncbi:MAG: hypothetical protein OES09_11015 [Gammaproteobacteria bacterium]|nr:hypothetical protein [Gammaproteobacteria bacterium]